jgi:hypothetical protein
LLRKCRAAAKEVGADAETFTTYLDDDTSRVLAVIRRTLQHVQESENKEAFNLTLRKPLDDIRLYAQSLCMPPTREESRPTSPPATTADWLVDRYNEFVIFVSIFQWIRMTDSSPAAEMLLRS